MKIGIIGAGGAGLAALRHSLEEGHDCMVFEQTGDIGGTWNYTDLTEVDENGLPIHSSMYQGLKTNLPKELMEYQDFSYKEKGKSYIDQKEVMDYINQFANHFNLIKHIKFFRHIIKVDPMPNQKWEITEENVKTNEVTKHIFNAVFVCVGNFSYPKIPDILGAKNFTGKAIHSHHYRKSDEYRDKRVLIIGAGPSGTDISRLVGGVARKVFLSYGKTIFSKTADTIVHKPLVKSLGIEKVLFEDGSEEAIDNVIYCTGYHYTYPFLTTKCGIKVEDNWVKYLYKHIVNVEHPTMGFIGIIFKVCPFPTFDIQVRFFLAILKGNIQISKEEMMRDILSDANKRKERAEPVHYTHKIGHELQGPYFDNLANTAKIEKVRPVVIKLYKHLNNNRSTDIRYKIVNDEEFIEELSESQ